MPFEPMPPDEKKVHFAHLYASPETIDAWDQAYGRAWATLPREASGRKRISLPAWILALAQAARDAGVEITEEE